MERPQSEKVRLLIELAPPRQVALQRLGLGSTRAIYDFIKDTNYVELIPKALMNSTNPCGEACDLAWPAVFP